MRCVRSPLAGSAAPGRATSGVPRPSGGAPASSGDSTRVDRGHGRPHRGVRRRVPARHESGGVAVAEHRARQPPGTAAAADRGGPSAGRLLRGGRTPSRLRRSRAQQPRHRSPDEPDRDSAAHAAAEARHVDNPLPRSDNADRPNACLDRRNAARHGTGTRQQHERRRLHLTAPARSRRRPSTGLSAKATLARKETREPQLRLPRAGGRRHRCRLRHGPCHRPRFAGAGAAVVLADTNQQALRTATDALTAAGHRALAVT